MKRLLVGLAALLLCTTPTQAAPVNHLIDAINIPRYTEHVISDHRETLCMALNVYHEARGSTRQDQIGVAWVVRNRAARTGHSYCRTIWAPGQFSWTPRSTSSLIPREMAAWNRAVRISRQVMADEVADPTGGARNFRSARTGGRGLVIGGHRYW